MSWKITAYLAATLIALFALIAVMPTDHNAVALLSSIFVTLLLVTTLGGCYLIYGAARKVLKPARRR